MNSLTIKISDDFSKYPGLRYERLTPGCSGEKFRDELLIPALDEHSNVTVNLDAILGQLVPSFLEECFGGLARLKSINLNEFKLLIQFISDDKPYLVDDIYEYVDKAHK